MKYTAVYEQYPIVAKKIPIFSFLFSQLSKAAKDISIHLGNGVQSVADNLEGAFIQFGSDTAERAGMDCLKL